jgi:hypothetical protein
MTSDYKNSIVHASKTKLDSLISSDELRNRSLFFLIFQLIQESGFRSRVWGCPSRTGIVVHEPIIVVVKFVRIFMTYLRM